MKKQNIIFSALFLTLTTMPTYTFALTASGIVVDETGEPLMLTTIRAVNSQGEYVKDSKGNAIGTKTDANGNFTLDVSAGDKLKISFVGYDDQVIEPGKNLNIKLEEDKNQVKEVVSLSTKEGDACEADRIKDDYANKEAKGKIKIIDGNKHICVPNECIQDYEVKDGACVHKECSKQELKALNAAEGKYEGGKCVVEKCADKYHFDEKNTCVKNQCEKGEDDWIDGKCVKVRCTQDELNAIKAKNGKWENDKCVPTTCEDGKNFKLENGSCVANDCPEKELEKTNAVSGHMENGKCIIAACKDGYSLENGACVNKNTLAEKQKAYDEAHAKEQSLENRTLTAVTTAATGIGGMELMQGKAEQSADEDAMADMAAYIETMRCTYADGKQVKAGPEEIELPGANDQELMNLRGQYLALAADLKERKTALGMKAGIESEEIIDRTATGLYDDENIAITKGNYSSIYRAQMLGSEADQAKIAEEQKTSANRVKYGALAAGAGVVIGLAGNELINGKLGELLKSKKTDNPEEVKVLEQEVKALDDLKKCLSDAGVKETDKLGFKKFYPSVLTISGIDCKKIELKSSPVNASDIFVDSNNEGEIFDNMYKYLNKETISMMLGFANDESVENIKAKIKSSMTEKQKEIDEAQKKDVESSKSKASSDGGLGDLAGKAKDLLGNVAK